MEGGGRAHVFDKGSRDLMHHTTTLQHSSGPALLAPSVHHSTQHSPEANHDHHDPNPDHNANDNHDHDHAHNDHNDDHNYDHDGDGPECDAGLEILLRQVSVAFDRAEEMQRNTRPAAISGNTDSSPGGVAPVRQTQCRANCFILDSRRVLAPASKVLGPKQISNPDFVPFWGANIILD